MSNPASISGVDLTTTQGRQILQDALDVLYGLIQKAGGTAAGPTTFDELRVRMLTVLGTINVVPEDKPPANVNSRLVTPWLTGQRGRGEVWRFEDQKDGGDLLEVRSQPYLIGTPTATAGDWEFRFTSAQRDPAGAYRSLGAIRFGSDGRLRTYDASEVLLFDSTLALTAANAPLPKRYVEGLVIRYAGIASFTVTAGKARNKLDTADMTLAALTTVNLSTLAINDLEAKVVSAANCAVSIGSAVITGTGTSFLTAFQSRVLTGTSQTVTASTTVTGTSTKYLSEVAVGDMYGNTTGGFSRVTAIASDTSMTVAVAITLVNGAAVSVIEGSSVYLDGLAGGASGTMSKITSNTSITCAVNFGSNKSSKDLYHGWGGEVSQWLAVWLVSGSSGTGLVVSNQRTMPYVASGSAAVTPTGYATSYRRIGWVRISSSGTVEAIDTVEGWGARRWFAWRTVPVGTGAGAASNASSTNTPAIIEGSAAAPPTATLLMMLLATVDPNTVGTVRLQAGGTGNAGGVTVPDSALFIQATAPSTSTRNNVVGVVACNGAQQTEHWGVGFTSGDGTYTAVQAWQEDLE